MLNRKKEVLYVGKATSLKSRVNSYFRGQRNKDARKLEMLTQTHDIEHIECGSALEAAILETDEIKRHDPPYNFSLKRKQRQLAFFSKDLASMNYAQTDAHPVGPFSGHFALEQLTRVQAWLTTNEDDPLIFFDQVPQELITNGFELFCEIKKIDPTMISTTRQLMACCIKLLQSSSRKQILQIEESMFDDEPDYDEEPDGVDDELTELTVEDVAGKFGRLFQRSAKSYLRGKLLTRLLDCRVIFEENSTIRRLEVRGGNIIREEQAPELSHLHSSLPWAELDVMTYDRMSVLLAEILRMRSAGQNVIIEPDMPLSVVSHRIT